MQLSTERSTNAIFRHCSTQLSSHNICIPIQPSSSITLRMHPPNSTPHDKHTPFSAKSRHTKIPINGHSTIRTDKKETTKRSIQNFITHFPPSGILTTNINQASPSKSSRSWDIVWVSRRKHHWTKTRRHIWVAELAPFFRLQRPPVNSKRILLAFEEIGDGWGKLRQTKKTCEEKEVIKFCFPEKLIFPCRQRLKRMEDRKKCLFAGKVWFSRPRKMFFFFGGRRKADRDERKIDFSRKEILKFGRSYPKYVDFSEIAQWLRFSHRPLNLPRWLTKFEGFTFFLSLCCNFHCGNWGISRLTTSLNCVFT